MINFKPVQQNFEFFSIVKPLGASIPLSSGERVKADVVDILPSGGVVLRIKDSYITVKTEIPLTKENQLLLKVLELKDNTLRLQILDIKSNKSQLTEGLNQILKTNPELLVQSFEKLPPQTQREVIAFLQSQIKPIPVEKLNYSLNPENINPENLKKAVENSGIFFENKILKILNTNQELLDTINRLPDKLKDTLIKAIQQTNINNFQQNLIPLLKMISDLKESQPQIQTTLKNIPPEHIKLLQELIKETQLDKKLSELVNLYDSLQSDLKLEKETQHSITAFQELSILTDSLYGFLPLRWDGLRYSNFKYKKNIDNSGKSYNFIVNLEFEDGKLSFITTYRQDKISITLLVENSKLRTEISKQKAELFNILKDAGLDIEYIEVLPHHGDRVEKTV